MSKPTTALLIPCYNAERYLENLRKQVDALDPAFDELVIVDDGSTDGTVAKARALGFDIIPLGTNRGPGAARNEAAKRATAEWIHFLDADDEIAPDYLAKVLPMAGDAVDVVLCSCDFLDEVTRERIMRWSFEDSLYSREPLKGCIRTGVNTPSSLIRRRKFAEIGGFNEERRCWEDGDMHLRLALAGARFRAIPDVLSFGIRHRRGTSGNELYCHRCRLEFLEKYADYVPRIDAEDLVNEAVINASRLYREGDKANAMRALDLACRFGWKGPESRNPLLAALAEVPSRRLRKLLFLMQAAKRQGKPRINTDERL
jgi:glycosyltransferase involved in cell wall biosynthesis